MNILVVDDHADSLTAMEAALAVLDQTVVRARSGREALRELIARDYAVVLLDVRLPDLHGFELAKMIRERERSENTPILFVTGHEDASTAILRGYASGAVDYLLKPVDPEILRSKVSVFVELARHRELLEAANRQLGDAARLLQGAEARYRGLVEQLPPVLFLYRAAPGGDGTLRYVGPQVEAMLGYTPEEWGDPVRRREAIHPADRDQSATGRLTAGETRPGRRLRAEYRVRTRDGRVRWCREEAMVVAGEPGERPYLMGFLLDVTDRVEAERLRAQTAAAEAASLAKSRFLASMSHELRTPLNSVIGFANLLLKRPARGLEERELEFVRRIEANGRHLLELVNQVLDLAKIETGHVEVGRGPVDLARLARETLAELEGQVGGRPVELAVEAPDDLAPVLTDEGKLRQVLVNLAGNAIKFTERGRVTIRIETEPGTPRPVRIAVGDTGVGIAPDRLARIFDTFQEGGAGPFPHSGGSGLGLAISQSLAALLGCRLEASSREGEGATFTVVLPAAPVEVARG